MNKEEKYIAILENSQNPSELIRTVEPDILNSPVFLGWIADHKELIRYLPVDSLTSNSAMFIFSLDRIGASLLVGSSRREDLCLTALKVNPELVTFIPKGVRSEDFYQKAVANNPEVYCNFPNAWKTREYYTYILNNIQKAPQVIAHIPYKDQKLQLFKDVSDPEVIFLMFECIALKDITVDIAHEAVSKEVHNFYRIPESILTPELSLMAFMKDESIHRFVPDRIRKENNIYSFYRGLAKTMNKQLSLEEVKKLYNKMTFANIADNEGEKVSMKWSESKRNFMITKKKSMKRKL